MSRAGHIKKSLEEADGGGREGKMKIVIAVDALEHSMGEGRVLG